MQPSPRRALPRLTITVPSAPTPSPAAPAHTIGTVLPAPPASPPSYTIAPDGAFVHHGKGFSIDGAGLTAPGVGSLPLRGEDVKLGAVLGRGACSVVHHAVHVPTGTQLALKSLPVLDRSRRDQLMRELGTLSGCGSSPALTSLLGAYCAESIVYIALEFMDAGSLEAVCAAWGGPIPEYALAGVSYQVLLGLAHLRASRRLHRDVKPSNILLSSDGAVKLSDFGLSAALDTSLGAAHTFVGTSRYMAPERITHAPYSFPSDVWSAGLVLWSAATGMVPFASARGYVDIAESICEGPAVLLPEDGTSVSLTGAAAALGAGAGAGGSPPMAELRFSESMRTCLNACLLRSPMERLPADVLLGSPWFKQAGVTSLLTARAAVRRFLTEVRLPGGGGGAGVSSGGGSSGLEVDEGPELPPLGSELI